MYHVRIVKINFSIIVNIEKNSTKCICVIRSSFNSLSMQLLKVHFHSFFFIFKNFVAFYFQTEIIFKHFFHRNIIEKKKSHISFSLDYSIFQQIFKSVTH